MPAVYAVHVGDKPGIYLKESEMRAAIGSCANAQYHCFTSKTALKEAKAYVEHGSTVLDQKKKEKQQKGEAEDNERMRRLAGIGFDEKADAKLQEEIAEKQLFYRSPLNKPKRSLITGVVEGIFFYHEPLKMNVAFSKYCITENPEDQGKFEITEPLKTQPFTERRAELTAAIKAIDAFVARYIEERQRAEEVEFLIVTQSRFLYDVLSNRMHEWAKNDFKSAQQYRGLVRHLYRQCLKTPVSVMYQPKIKPPPPPSTSGGAPAPDIIVPDMPAMQPPNTQ